MSISFVAGDLFASGLPALAHGCNCAGAMGKGIAVEFKSRFPEMYSEYRRRCASGEFDLGDVFVWRAPSVVVFNLGTQKTWRTKAKLPDVRTALIEMARLADEQRIPRVGLPKIGAGLGGLPWPSVRSVLQEVGSACATELVVYEEFAPGGSSRAV